MYMSPEKNVKFEKNIMTDMAILCGDEYRENTLDSGVYSYIEPWYRTTGSSKSGLYMYNFCVNSNRLTYQPTGAQNTNKWQYIVFEFSTLTPPSKKDGESEISILCGDDGELVQIRKNIEGLNEYNYDLRVFEERYNIIEILGGNIGLLLAR